jgi:hypothetical protein
MAHEEGHKAGGGAKKTETKKKPEAEPVPQLVMPDKAARTKLFHDIDVNGNGGLSLAEIDKAVVSGQIGQAMNCPDFNHKPAIMRAYKAADTDGDAFIERREFGKLLKYVRLDFRNCASCCRFFVLLRLARACGAALCCCCFVLLLYTCNNTAIPPPSTRACTLLCSADGSDIGRIVPSGSSCTSTTSGTSLKRSTAIMTVGSRQRSLRTAARSLDLSLALKKRQQSFQRSMRTVAGTFCLLSSAHGA